MRASRNQIIAWAEALTESQIKTLVPELVQHMMDSEDVCFWNDNLAPYWESDGEPLVPGQKTYQDQE